MRSEPPTFAAQGRGSWSRCSVSLVTLAALSEAEFALALRRNRWSSWLEFLLVGGATLFLLPLSRWIQHLCGLDAAEYWTGFFAFHAALVVNNPHFAVTYLLFYRRVRERAFGAEFSALQRARYWLAGAFVPLALGLWLGFALVDHSARRLGWLIQLMFFLVGWHYVKQGFGVLTVLSARRGVRFSARERKIVLFHCIAGWLCARANPRDLGKEQVVDDVLYVTIGHPPGLDRITQIVFVASCFALAWMLYAKWRREQRVLPLAPLCGLLVSVWLWTLYSRIDPLMIYLIPALHSLQYLYFVALWRRNMAREQAGASAFRSVSRALFKLALAAIALGWLLFRAIPGWLDHSLVLWDPLDRLGTTPYLAAIGTFVNIHHYFMDSVIWRRDNPDARYLLA